MNRNIDDLGRIVIPKEMRKQLNINPKDELNIELEEDMIILTKVQPTERQMKTIEEIEEHLHNLNELIKIGLDDEKLIGSIEALNWVLDTTEDKNRFLNDYDDVKEEPVEEV